MSESLFGRGELGEATAVTEANNAPVEHQHLPEARKGAEKKPTVVFSFDSAEDRDRLVAELGLVVKKKEKGAWVACWPPGSDQDERVMTLDL